MNELLRTFEKPEMEVVEFACEDIIVTSEDPCLGVEGYGYGYTVYSICN